MQENEKKEVNVGADGVEKNEIDAFFGGFLAGGLIAIGGVLLGDALYRLVTFRLKKKNEVETVDTEETDFREVEDGEE